MKFEKNKIVVFFRSVYMYNCTVQKEDGVHTVYRQNNL